MKRLIGTVLAILAPIVALLLLAGFFLILARLVRRLRRSLDLGDGGPDATEPAVP